MQQVSDQQPPRRGGSWDVWVWSAIGYGLVIFILGSLRTAPAPRHMSDKLEHAIGFGLLAWVWCRALRRLRPAWTPTGVGAGGFAVSVALGGALEIWQGFLRYRSCELLDWVADARGAGIAAALFVALGSLFGARARAAE